MCSSDLEDIVVAMPDIAEIVVNTIINPASGVTTLIQKVAQRVAKSQKEKAAEEEKEQADSAEPQAQETQAPAKVDTEAAAEALNDLHEDLEKMPDSPEKEVVAQTLQQLEAEADKDDGEGLLDNVVEALPEIGEAVVETIQKITENQDE